MAVRLIDAHSHINFNAYKDDAEAVIARVDAQGVAMLAVGSQITTSERAAEYAERHGRIWAVVGLHPTHLFEQYVDDDEISYKSRNETFDPGRYGALARRSKKVVGIGECGLDYYRLPPGVPQEQVKERQERTFRQHLDLALDLGLPVMVHCRDAHGDLAAILESYAAAGKKLRGDIHCFTGTWAEAERYLALGFHISFTGIITFPPKKGGGETLQDVVRNVPLNRMLVETDAPYLAPEPCRGRTNEPAFARHTAEFLARLKDVPFDEFARVTSATAERLFGL